MSQLTSNVQDQATPTAPGVLRLLSMILFGLAIGCILGLASLLFFYAVPVWDDLIRATRPNDVGWWGYVYGFVYKHWQGRWASCGLESFILPRVDISRYYWMLLCSVAGVDAIGVYAVCRWFAARKSFHLVAGIAAGFLALLWTGMPSVNERPAVSETVYWFTGAVENAMVYSLAALVLMGVIAITTTPRTEKKRTPSPGAPGEGGGEGGSLGIAPLVARNHPHPNPLLEYRERGPEGVASMLSPSFATIGLCIAAIMVCGFHELYGLMFCIALAIGCAAALVDRSSKLPIWVAVTAAAGLGLLVVILAPGNSARFVSDGGRHARQFGYDLRVALAQVRHFVPRWILDPKLIGVSLWVLMTPLLKRPTHTGRFPFRWVIPSAWLIMLAAGFFAPSWAFGNAMPPRTIAGVYICFVLGWLITLWLWSPTLPPLPGRWSGSLASVGLILFSISMFVTGTAHSAWNDYRYRIGPWHNATEHRYAVLRQSAGTDALIPPLPKPPWNLLDGEIGEKPDDYRNWSTVSFFHLRSVRLIPAHGPPDPPPDKPTRPPAKGMGT